MDDPAVELASFQIADGFDVSLFASEKDGVVKPIQMRFDARGRLWVIGSTVYPQIEPGDVPNDKVLILEDTNGDGRCDKTTVFADGLMIPTGIELGDGGAYVGHGTELLFLKDMDGDGRADERRVVLRGFGTGDNHQNINSFLWGPGGELWMCQGLHTRSHVETPWGISHLEQAGIWRLRPRLLRLEGFYGSAHEPQNPWGFVFTDWGEPIVLAGNNSSPIYPVPGLMVNHRDDPPTIIWKNGNGRKVGGGDIVGTAHFPEAWQGALIVGGYINNAVWTLKISDDGAGFILEDLPPLIKSSSRSFRPVDAKFGPDGALYLCDWYNPIIGHYQASFRHPDRDKTHGRIWRVTAKGRPLTKPPQLADARITDLLDYLKSSDRWTRHFAKRVLTDRPTDQVTAALKEFIAKSLPENVGQASSLPVHGASSPRVSGGRMPPEPADKMSAPHFQTGSKPGLSEHALKEALGVYQSHEVIAPELLARLGRSNDAGARAYAASVVGAWVDRLPDPLALLRPLIADPNPRVRLQAVVACAGLPKPEAMEVVAIAADLPTDKFLSYALNQAVFALKPYWLPAFKQGKLNLENKRSRLDLFIRADATPDTLQAVRELLQASKVDREVRESYFRLLAENGEASDLAAILTLSDAALQTRLLPIVATAARVRNVRPAEVAQVMRSLVANQNAELRAEALKLAGIWNLEEFRPATEVIALDVTAKETIRRSAIEALASFGGDASLNALRRLARGDVPFVQGAAIAALCSVDITLAARLAAASFDRLKDDAVLAEIFSAFLQRQGGADALATELLTKAPPKYAAEIGLRLMSATGRRNERLTHHLTRAAGFDSLGIRFAIDEVTAFASEARASGDAKRGAEIFRRAELGCVACHAVNGQGGNIGPDLSALGTAQPVDLIIGAILDPQKEVKEGYVSVSVLTKGGDEYQGYQIRETRDELVLRDVLQNREVRLRRDTIKEKKQNGSVMPTGLVDPLTRTEFRDLVRFLSELGQPK